LEQREKEDEKNDVLEQREKKEEKTTCCNSGRRKRRKTTSCNSGRRKMRKTTCWNKVVSLFIAWMKRKAKKNGVERHTACPLRRLVGTIRSGLVRECDEAKRGRSCSTYLGESPFHEEANAIGASVRYAHELDGRTAFGCRAC